jgi:formyltetrahydrofolate deformylase
MRFNLGLDISAASGLCAEFRALGNKFGMSPKIHCEAGKPKALILVSRHGHCVNDLHYSYWAGYLRMEIPAIASNPIDFYQAAASYNIPVFHLPVTRDDKAHLEEKPMEIVHEKAVDLVGLALPIQILSATVCSERCQRPINIHLRFLPSLKGAKPCMQAHQRGVKLIAARVHFVTTELDEGLIVEQSVARVDRSIEPETLAALGHKAPSVVRARAVKGQTKGRIMPNDRKTVAFC